MLAIAYECLAKATLWSTHWNGLLQMVDEICLQKKTNGNKFQQFQSNKYEINNDVKCWYANRDGFC